MMKEERGEKEKKQDEVQRKEGKDEKRGEARQQLKEADEKEEGEAEVEVLLLTNNRST